MLCKKEILYHGFLCFTAITVTVTQATLLNFYIIAFFRGYRHHVRKSCFNIIYYKSITNPLTIDI